MSSKQFLFNKNLISHRLNDFSLDAIKGINEKMQIVQNWKYSIETTDLEHTKEMSVKGYFFTDFFTGILGYKKIIGNKQWEVELEQSTELDGTTADGILGFFSTKNKDVRVVVEIKEAKTNLDARQKGRNRGLSAIDQAFLYASKFQNCDWVIVSNFTEIRLYSYHGRQLNYELFRTTELVDEFHFKRFYFLLNHDNLIAKIRDSVTNQLYKSNLTEETAITKKFYKDYKSVRSALLNQLRKHNPNCEKLLLLEKVQKIMDRYIFVRFCEGTGLIPVGTFKQTIDLGRVSFDTSNQRIWKQVQWLFKSIDEGNPPHDINRFNGGLFAPDDILDNMIIIDDIFAGFDLLNAYDFSTDLNINILGHIFEQTISDLEHIKSEIRNEKPTRFKRKDDGIYYTPSYITQYITEKTIGNWLQNRKRETANNFSKPTSSSSMKENMSTMPLEFWLKYRDVLSKIKIADIACGSGAFLNYAFDYLRREWEEVERNIRKLNAKMGWPGNIDKHILSSNIFGVDINRESVEITKLSLWLKTANKTDPLAVLDNNIKAGNSIIDNPDVDNTALDWKTEFQDIILQGGFDVIIGNPPWGAKVDSGAKKYLRAQFVYASEGKTDTYRYFYERAFSIVNTGGNIGFITPNTFLYNVQSQKIRQMILDNTIINEAIELRKNIFDDSPDVVPAILLLQKSKPLLSYNIPARVAFADKKYDDLSTSEWLLNQNINCDFFRRDLDNKINLRLDMRFAGIRDKMEKSAPLSTWFNLKQGTKPYGNKVDKNDELIAKNRCGDEWDKAINGRNLRQFSIEWENDFVLRSEKLHSRLPDDVVKQEKLYFQRMRKVSLFPRIVAAYDAGRYHGLYTCSAIYPKPGTLAPALKYVLCLLNSHLVNVWYKNFDTDIEIKLESVKKIPIPEASSSIQEWFCQKADNVIVASHELENLKAKFTRYLNEMYNIAPTKKIIDVGRLSFGQFCKELDKQVVLTDAQEFGVMPVFEKTKTNCNLLSIKIKSCYKEIDDAVYDLFELTLAERKIVNAVQNPVYSVSASDKIYKNAE